MYFSFDLESALFSRETRNGNSTVDGIYFVTIRSSWFCMQLDDCFCYLEVWKLLTFICYSHCKSIIFSVDCRMAYLDTMWMFEYSEQTICQTYLKFNDLGKITFFAISNVVLDTITVTRLCYKKQKLQKSTNSMPSVLNKKEIDFLKQSFSQGIMLFLGLSVFIFAPEMVMDPMRAFLMSSLFWCFLHAFDGWED
ncbi:hypothetical protein CRE_05069 [Caenorhabditis remanei]|uniref:7TM GPCR serpentine receptor class x (Srx) domain-containing protein n=1 Tax=Caenorhabditis remanei TaxID=31234 RepID=E3MZ13_CAERE|nr:hypothetical protein CRE_05069 [Caenorhabditis remanei]